MKVKIGDKVYDANKEPVMIICSHQERQQMASMPEDNTKYCQYPDEKQWAENDYAAIKKWMEID